MRAHALVSVAVLTSAGGSPLLQDRGGACGDAASLARDARRLRAEPVGVFAAARRLDREPPPLRLAQPPPSRAKRRRSRAHAKWQGRAACARARHRSANGRQPLDACREDGGRPAEHTRMAAREPPGDAGDGAPDKAPSWRHRRLLTACSSSNPSPRLQQLQQKTFTGAEHIFAVLSQERLLALFDATMAITSAQASSSYARLVEMAVLA
eukprot:6188296-Pleurochrysis_carterae.AAC.5